MPSTSKHLKWYNTVKCISSVRHLVNHLNLFFFKRFISIFIFISDSRTAKQSITTLLFEWKVLPIIIFIRNLLKVLIHFHNCEICFIWVPGNGRADFLVHKTLIRISTGTLFLTLTSSLTSDHNILKFGLIIFVSASVITLLVSEVNPLSRL